MLKSNRTFSHIELKKALKQSKQMSNIMNYKSKQLVEPMCYTYSETELFRQVGRQNEVKVLELKNELIKKQIELKEKVQSIKDLTKQIGTLRKEKEGFIKTKSKFENQRKQQIHKITQLEAHIQQMKQDIKFDPPKDRYETCMRQLDELKVSIESREDVIKERDLYKFFYEQIRELATSNRYSSQKVHENLKILFHQLDDQVFTIK